MVRIELHNFKCYKKASFNLNDGKITLISGHSGIGKTTIILSIYWCLYAKAKKICRNGTSGKCSVTIHFEDSDIIKYGISSIYRQSRPNLLRLHNDKKSKAEDQVAQSIIDREFGTWDVWFASSYIAQKKFALLISGSNKERMNILNKLSFLSDNPEKIINRIDEKIKSYTSNFSSIQENYRAEKKIYDNDMKIQSDIFKHMVPIEEIDGKKDKLDTMNDEYNILLDKKKEQNINEGKIEMLQNRMDISTQYINTLKSNCDSIVLPLDPEAILDNIRSSHKSYEIEYIHKNKDIKNKLDENNKIIDELKLHQVKFQEYLKLYCKELNNTKELDSCKEKDKYILTRIESEKQRIADSNINRDELILHIKNIRENIKKYILSYNSESENKKNIQSKIKKYKDEYNKISEQNKEIDINIHNYEYKIKDTMISLGTHEKDHESIITKINTLSDYQKNINKNKKININNEKEIWTIQQQESNYDKSIQSYKSYNINHDKKAREDALNKIKDNINELKFKIVKYNKYIEIYSMEIELNKLNIQEPYIELEDIIRKKEHLKKLRQRDELLLCPNCNSSLMMVPSSDGNLLCPSQEIYISNQEKEDRIHNMEDEIKNMNKKYKLSEQGRNIKNKIKNIISQNKDYDNLDDNIKNNIHDLMNKFKGEVGELENQYMNISKLEYVKIPTISSKEATQHYNYSIALSKKDNISNKINNYKKEIETYKQELNKQKSIYNNRGDGDGDGYLDKSIQKYEIEMEECMTNITEYYKLYTTELRNQDKYENIFKEYNKNIAECEILEGEHLKIEEDVKSLTKIHNENIERTKINLCEHGKNIHSWVDSIQNGLLSNDPTLALSFKELSSDSLIKPDDTTIESSCAIIINNINIIYISFSNDIIKLDEELEILNVEYNNKTIEFNEKEKELVLIEFERKQKIYELEQINTRIEKESTLLDSMTLEYKKYKDIIIPNIDEQIEYISQNMRDMEISIECATRCLVFTERKLKLREKYSDVVESHKYLSALNKYRKICIDVECNKLQATVNSINAIMNDTLDMLFDENMSVYIKLYKKIKSNGRIKPSVNLQIMYKGYEIDSLLGLSGGEGDRVSLSLAIAMSRNSKSPFLLLDETMSSVGESLRSKSINAIRHVLQNSKTVICVGHIDTEGNYDDVMRLDEQNITKIV
uniref:Chromosome segregation ATPase n=1 Tax=Pithovirus LCPAC101 TaxID=2506586 RepID=A0A481Z2Z0_9VIRU|nr:MAG: chromosome segregation ATPase [Pithovirus LCPAC101]